MSKRRRTDTTKVRLSSNGFERCVGYTLSASGKRNSRRFYLGHNKPEAISRAVKIAELWQGNLKDGGDVWNKRYLGYATQIANGSYDENNFAIIKPEDQSGSLIAWDEPIADEGGGANLHDALTSYIESVKHSGSRAANSKNIIRHIERIRAAAEDQPIGRIGFDGIKTIAAYWLSLPLSQTKASRGKLPISPETAANHCKQLRRFFRWLDAADSPDFEVWRLPRNFENCIVVNRAVLAREYKLRTGESKAKSGVRIFSDAELAQIWDAADSRQRLCIALALNIGATQGDIAALRKDELVDWNGTPFIDRERTKTGEAGRFLIWSKTRELIDIHRNGGAQLFKLPPNTISSSWYSLRKKLSKSGNPLADPSPFKSLRKTGAQAILSVSDEATASAYLAHNSASTDKILEGVYINRDYRRLTEALGVVGQRWAKILK